MSETKINLEKILEEIFEPCISPEECPTPTIDLQTAIILNPELNRIKLAMRMACERVLKLAAENAKISVKKKSQYGKYRKWQKVKEGENIDLFSYEMQTFINKDSILNIINQIE